MPKFAGVPKSDEDTDYLEIVVEAVSQTEAMVAGGVLALVIIIAIVRAAMPEKVEYDDVFDDRPKPPRKT